MTLIFDEVELENEVVELATCGGEVEKLCDVEFGNSAVSAVASSTSRNSYIAKISITLFLA